MIEWLGLEGTLNIIYFQPPAMGSDKALSKLALSTSR